MYTDVSIPFGSGLDTKTDPKMLDAPKTILLRDCLFTNIKRLSKRPGFNQMTNALIGGGTFSSPKMVKSYQNETILAATTSSGQRLLSYSSALSGWADTGKCTSIGTNFQSISSRDGFINSSFVSLNGIGYFLSNSATPTVSSTYNYCLNIIDLATGNSIASDVIPGAIQTEPYAKLVVLGGVNVGIIFGTTTSLSVQLLSVNLASGFQFGSLNTISSNYASPYGFDVSSTFFGGVISFTSGSNTVTVATLTTLGFILGSATVARPAGGARLIHSVNQNGATGNIWVYFFSSNTSLIYYAVFSSFLAVVLARTTLVSTTYPGLRQMTAYPFSATQQYLYFSNYTAVTNTASGSNPTVAYNYPQIYVAPAPSSGSGTGLESVYLYNLEIEGNVFTTGTSFYLPVVSISPTYSTCFLVDLSDNYLFGYPSAASKFLQGRAEGLISSQGAPIVIFQRSPGHLTTPQILSTTTAAIGCGYQISQSTQTASYGPSTQSSGVVSGVCMVTFDFASQDAFQGLIAQDTLVINGSLVRIYDGASCTELGFNTDPDNVVINVTTGGSMATGDYIYYLLYSWTDANGNLHQSSPSISYKVNIAAGSGKCTITVCTLGLSQKLPTFGISGPVSVYLYRTLVNGQIPYLLQNAPMSPANPSYTFIDSAADASITNFNPLYTEGGAILDNIAPPPSMILWENSNRVWAIDNENPSTLAQYSKTASQGLGISFSTGLLEYVFDSKYGEVTGASAMDEKTVLLKKNGVGYFIGDGANDAGTGSTLSNFQFVPSDTGCSNSKSVILYPGGILFRASNNKGIYIFSRGIQVAYFGMDVQAYNSQDIQNAKILGDKNQIRFLTSSGNSLLYDYVMNQWSILSNHLGLSADVFDGVYTYVKTDGNLYQEDQTGIYLDNGVAYSPLIQMSWIKASTIQGFERMRRIVMLGDFQTATGAHGVQVSVAYDFDSTFSTPVPYIFTGSNGSFQYRERVPRQKCDAFQLQIQEITTSAVGEFIDFSDLALEILAKTGMNKLPGSRSVG